MASSTRRLRSGAVLIGLALVLAGAIVLGIGAGAAYVAPAEVLAALWRAVVGGRAGFSDAVVVGIRLPRVLLAALVGAALAGAGALYQALFRNPLADPYILGVSSGAGLGTIIAMVLTAHVTGLRLVAVPAASFAGAVITMILVVRLATSRGRLDAASLLLAGVAISYTLAAMTSFVMVFSRESMASVVFWMMGGLAGASWPQVGMLAVITTIGFALPLLTARELNLMVLGEERAGNLGLDVERYKLLILASASLVVAGAVSVSGLIGFVGLMTPHMVRLALGPDHRVLLPASVLGGAAVLVIADLVARTVLAPVELPVGIVTALLGGPFFVWLLTRREESL